MIVEMGTIPYIFSLGNRLRKFRILHQVNERKNVSLFTILLYLNRGILVGDLRNMLQKYSQ